MPERLTDLPVLNLPEAALRLRELPRGRQIYDAFRKKWVSLTPEEWVRQHMLHYIHQHCAYPANKIAVEFSLTVNGLKKRADILVWNRQLEPWLLIECKNTSVILNQEVMDQMLRYNLKLKVPYMAMTNGNGLLVLKNQNGKAEVLDVLPAYEAER
jgi:hypothetical protein